MSPTIDLREPDRHTDRDPVADDARARIADAAVTCWSRVGLAKTTLDDVAREAGCSRATVYRYFANRPALVAAVVDREVDRLVATIQAAGSDADSCEDAVVAMYVAAARAIADHDALQRALAFEPEVVLPALSFEGGDLLLAESGRRFAPALARFVPPDRASRAAEWCTRVFLAYLHPDRAAMLMTDDATVRALVRRHVIPALSPRIPSPTR
ncbi:MAG: TetR/AcrR family transcriptional regulator [Acidimicrobiia bacterium]